jgi:hypothetical protein
MNSKNIFSRLFSLLVMATLLAACSQNDDNATTTNNTDTNANRAAPLNLPRKGLIIRNNTTHTFVNDLWALNRLGATNPTWLSQKIIINPNTNIVLNQKYSNTTTQGIDFDGNGLWIKSEVNGGTSIISAQDADSFHRTTLLYDTTELGLGNEYVEWFTFNGTSEDGLVKFSFKVNNQNGEIVVNDTQGTFETTAYVDDSGDIIIILQE